MLEDETNARFDPEERIDLLLRHLGTSRSGLSEREARRRLEQHGSNAIERREGPSHLRDLARQFTHPLALLLWVAAALSIATGIVALTIAIVAVIVLNAVFAFTQELQAEHATEVLRELLPPQARVRRGGEVLGLDAATLVPGDLLLIGEGDRLSADARLIDGAVEIDASPLTGESQPVARSAHSAGRPAAAASSPLESEDLVFSGTLCTAGEAEAVVYATGMATHLGRIAALSQRVRIEVSPLHAAALIYLPPMQSAFGTAALSPAHLAVLVPFPLIVWGSDELRRWALRRRDGRGQPGRPLLTSRRPTPGE